MNPVKNLVLTSSRSAMTTPFQNSAQAIKNSNHKPFYGLVAAVLASGGAYAYYRPFSHKSTPQGKLEKAKTEGAKEQAGHDVAMSKAQAMSPPKTGPDSATPTSGQAPRC